MTETNTAVAAITTSKTAIASTERAGTTTEPLVDGATAIIYILLGAIILLSLAQLLANSIMTWGDIDAILEKQRRKGGAQDIQRAAARRAHQRPQLNRRTGDHR